MNKLVVFSIDALLSCELDVFEKLPHTGELLKDAFRAQELVCPYPTLTYPCHATLLTWCWPDRHGIAHNEELHLGPGRAQWHWWARELKEPTVLDIAKAHGLSTATVCWPVTAGLNADYCIGEIWAPLEGDDPTPWFERANSPGAMGVFERHKHRLRWMKTPEFDLFAAHCAADIVREFAPDVLLVHFSYLDHQRHQLGTHSPALARAYAFIDERVGMVTDAIKEKGLFADTRFVLLGDHGHLPCQRMFHLNSVLREMGLLRAENGAVAEYDMYAHSCALSAQIFLGPRMEEGRAYEILRGLKREYPEFIERVFTKAELKERYHVDGEFAFMLEAAPGVAFGKEAARECAVEDVNNSDYKFSVSTHGHMPEKGDKPPFAVFGPGVKKNAVLHGGNLTDAAPTMLRLLGIEAEGMDGTAFDVLAKECP